MKSNFTASAFIVAVSLSLSMNASADATLSKKDISWLEDRQEIKKLTCDSYYQMYADKGKASISKNAIFDIKEDFFKDGHVFNGGEFNCLFDVDVADKNKVTIYVKEKAYIDDVEIYFYRWGGSGFIGGVDGNRSPSGWDIGCETDAMSDEVTCYIYKDAFKLYKNKEGYTVVIGSEIYPGFNSYIRSGSDKPYESGDNGVFTNEDSKLIIDSLADSKKVVTRHTKYPYNSPIDKQLDVKFFNSALKALDTIYDKHI